MLYFSFLRVYANRQTSKQKERERERERKQTNDDVCICAPAATARVHCKRKVFKGNDSNMRKDGRRDATVCSGQSALPKKWLSVSIGWGIGWDWIECSGQSHGNECPAIPGHSLI